MPISIDAPLGLDDLDVDGRTVGLLTISPSLSSGKVTVCSLNVASGPESTGIPVGLFARIHCFVVRAAIAELFLRRN